MQKHYFVMLIPHSKKNRKHIEVEQHESKRNNYIIDAVLFIRQHQKQITGNNFHLHSQQ